MGKQGNVAWTVEPGPHGVWGPMVEHIDGKYTGTSRNAGYASPSEWIENDYKVFLGHKIENDWGLVNATSWDKTTVVIDYQSYQKGHFIMTWQLPQEGEVEPTELSSSRPASCSKCSPIIDPTGAGQYDKGVWVPKYINKPGVYVPNDDPAETNGFCVDCSYPSFHDQCKAAGCAIRPPPPPPKYASCIAHYINGQQDCKVCGEHGKVCVGTGSDSVCLDCTHGTHVDKQRCQIGACLKPPTRGCAKRTEGCQPFGGGFKIIECCAGSTCIEQSGSGQGQGYICV